MCVCVCIYIHMKNQKRKSREAINMGERKTRETCLHRNRDSFNGQAFLVLALPLPLLQFCKERQKN